MSDTFKTDYEGEPPEGVFLQISLRPNGKVGYRYTNNPEKWPTSGTELAMITGKLGLIWWQMNQWATNLMRASEDRQAALVELLAKLPGEGETSH